MFTNANHWLDSLSFRRCHSVTVWFTMTLLRVHSTQIPSISSSRVPWTKCNHSLPPIQLLSWTTVAFTSTLRSWSLLNQGALYSIQILYTTAIIPFIHIGVCTMSSCHRILPISTQSNFYSQQWSITYAAMAPISGSPWLSSQTKRSCLLSMKHSTKLHRRILLAGTDTVDTCNHALAICCCITPFTDK